MKKILLASLFVLLSMGTWARGPYFPSDFNKAPVTHGVVVMTSSFLIDNRDEDSYETPYLAPVLIKRHDRKFEVGLMSYQCELIDDGPYGALSCSFQKYHPENSELFISYQEALKAFEFFR